MRNEAARICRHSVEGLSGSSLIGWHPVAGVKTTVADTGLPFGPDISCLELSDQLNLFFMFMYQPT